MKAERSAPYVAPSGRDDDSSFELEEDVVEDLKNPPEVPSVTSSANDYKDEFDLEVEAAMAKTPRPPSAVPWQNLTFVVDDNVIVFIL